MNGDVIVRYAWDAYPLVNWLISLLAIVGLYGFLFFMYAKIVKRTAGYIFLAVTAVIELLTFLFYLEPGFIINSVLTGVGVTISLFTNLGDLRSFLANPFKTSRTKISKVQVDKVYSREELYKTIEATVRSLSLTKTGAIITFEKNTSLQDIVKNGVPVNAPVSRELLETIFYPGTRLHDGAVVIRDNVVVFASVFYTPTTKPFAGKYGSRHRAAIGISEISDAVTIVVSEETGRISFAVNGQLETVTQENFYRSFENYMDGIGEK